MKSPPARKLHRGHFAFMRALAQGLDQRASWDRYLRLEGEHTDLRKVRRTIAWIRDEFAAAARRERRPGTARLILLDTQRITAAPALPTLEEFAAAQGMEDFSTAEQVEAYEDAYPSVGRAAGKGGGAGPSSRRTRVVERQLEALRWLQDLVAQDPRPTDGVGAWLNPSLATRLERAGIPTLAALVERVNGIGARWWAQVPGVGERKAARILDWLHANEAVLGLRVGVHVAQPRMQLAPATLAAVVPPATALRPYEKFLVPREFDGQAGRYRAPRELCRLAAADDHAAIGAWLATKRSVHGAAGELSSTQRSYRKEAERLLLWAILERKTALSSLSVADAAAYGDFVRNPPASWCGPRHHQRWSPLWRPLEGPLTPAALRQSLVILRSLFAFLVAHHYLTGNPFAAAALPKASPRAPRVERTFSRAHWDHLETFMREHADTEARRRLRRALRWLYSTGARLSEIARARCGHLQRVVHEVEGGARRTTWLLSVAGASAPRQLPVPRELVDELAKELACQGLDRRVDAPSNRHIPVLARFAGGAEPPAGWSSSGMYQALKAFLARASRSLEGADARRLRRASTHWLRHAQGLHARQPDIVSGIDEPVRLAPRETDAPFEPRCTEATWPAPRNHSGREMASGPMD